MIIFFNKMNKEYIVKNDFSSVADDLWEKISKKIETKGLKETDINNAIEEVRSKKY